MLAHEQLLLICAKGQVAAPSSSSSYCKQIIFLLYLFAAQSTKIASSLSAVVHDAIPCLKLPCCEAFGKQPRCLFRKPSKQHLPLGYPMVFMQRSMQTHHFLQGQALGSWPSVSDADEGQSCLDI